MAAEPEDRYTWQVFDEDRWVDLSSDRLPATLKSKKAVIRAFNGEIEARDETGRLRRYRLRKHGGSD